MAIPNRWQKRLPLLWPRTGEEYRHAQCRQRTHASYVLKDIFKYKGLIIGSPTYSNRLFPEIESILDKIETREVKHRLYGYFGSFTWAGAAVKNLAAFGEKMKWEVVGVPVEQKQALKADKYEECWALGEEMAKKLKTEN